jgi:hypothetical protein
MRKLGLWAVLAVLAVGCASSKKEERPAEATTQAQEQAVSPEAMCPMAVGGTTVRAEDTQDGAALVFTTPSGDVQELRNRVATMAKRHEQMQAGGGCPCGAGMGPGPHHGEMRGGMPPPGGAPPAGGGPGPGGGMGPGPGGMGPPGGMTPEMHAGMMAMKAAKVRMEPVEGGARLVFTPADPSQLPALRQAVQTRAQMMSSGQCPMMKQGGPGGPPPPGAPPAPPTGAPPGGAR